MSRTPRDVPEFGPDGLLPPGDHPLTLDELRASRLVRGPVPRPADWDEAWRGELVCRLEGRLRQLWAVGIDEVYLAGSFCTAKPRPGDLDGFFRYGSGRGLVQLRQLNLLDPRKTWVWDDRARAAAAARGELPHTFMWREYRVDLWPELVDAETGAVVREARPGSEVVPPPFSEFLRRSRGGRPCGLVRLLPPASA